jgi:hypothetical protein
MRSLLRKFRSVFGRSSQTQTVSADKRRRRGMFLENLEDRRVFANLAPTISWSAGELTYREGTAALTLASGANLADTDSPNFDTGSLTVNVAGGTTGDKLGIISVGTAAGQISVSGSQISYGGTLIGTSSGGVDGSPLVVSFNASSSPAAAQQLLRSVTYMNTSAYPSVADRTITATVADGDGGSATTSGAKTIHVNQRPIANNDMYTLNEDTTLTLAAPGVLTNDTDANNDAITVSKVNGSTTNVGTAVALTGGSLTLNADGSFTFVPMANWNGTQTFTYNVKDVLERSTAGTVTLNVTSVDDAVVFSATSNAQVTTNTVTFVEDAGPVTLLPDATLSDIDASTLTSLTITHTGAQGTSDRIDIPNQGSAAGQIGWTLTSGSTTSGTYGGTLTYGGASIGTFSGAGYNVGGTTNGTLTVNLSGASLASVQALVRSVTYNNTNTYNPSTNPRSLLFTLAGANQTVSCTVNITPVNDPPQITLGGGVGYTERSAAVQIASAATVTDDVTTFANRTITVSFAGTADSQATLAVKHVGSGAQQIGVSGSNITYSGTAMATFSGGTAGSPLVISLGSNASLAAIQAMVRQVTYVSDNHNPAATYTINVAFNDGDGYTTTASKTINVTPVNEAPSISDVPDATTNEDTPLASVAFTLDDIDTSASALAVTATSSDQTLVPNGNIAISGTGANRTLTITPAPDAYGTVTITLTVSDGSQTASDSFVLTVNSDPNEFWALSVAGSTNAQEGPTGVGQNGVFTVSRSGSSDTAQPLNFSFVWDVTGQNAAGGSDGSFATSDPAFGNLTTYGNNLYYGMIPAGQLSVPLKFMPSNDGQREATEQVRVVLQPDNSFQPHYSLSASTATIDVLDNDQWVLSALGTTSAYEQGVVPGQFTITRSGETDLTNGLSFSFIWNMSPSNSADASDGSWSYADSSLGSITTYGNNLWYGMIPAGRDSVVLNFVPSNDSRLEPLEQVYLELQESSSYAPQYALASTPTAVINLVDNDQWQLSIEGTADANEEGPAPGQFVITRSGETDLTNGLSFSFQLDTSPDDAADSSDGSFSYADPSLGYLYTYGNNIWYGFIPAGRTSVAINFTPMSDSLPEPLEQVYLELQETGGYSPEYLPPADPNAFIALIDKNPSLAIKSVDWREVDGVWKASKANEMLWIDDTLRWVAEPHNLGAGTVSKVEWFKKPVSGGDWEKFGEDDSSILDGEATSPGSPGVGIWWIKATATLADGSVLTSQDVKRGLNEIVKTAWQYQDEIWQQAFLSLTDPNDCRIYPEADAPEGRLTEDGRDRTVWNEVDIMLQAAIPVPPDMRAVRAVKVFDPDHAFDPTDTGEKVQNLDPNDEIDWDEPDHPLIRGVDDNRVGGLTSGLMTGGELSASLVRLRDSSGLTTLKVTNPQPGNNFIVASAPHSGILGAAAFRSDGVTLTEPSVSDAATTVDVLSALVTPIITVWRRLHLERDSMGTPDAVTDGPFDDPVDPGEVEPENYDPMPTLPQTLSIAEMKRFAAANILPVDDVEYLNDNRGGTDVPFLHNLDAINRGAIEPWIDVPNSPDFWSLNILASYEGGDDMDNDGMDMERPAVGEWIGPARITVYLETERDVYQQAVDAGQTVTLALRDELALSVLHEAAHTFIGDHGQGPISEEGPLQGIDFNTTPEDYNFTNRQLARLQGTRVPGERWK